MKKLLSILLTLVMMFAIVACGGDKTDTKEPADDTDKEVAESEEADEVDEVKDDAEEPADDADKDEAVGVDKDVDGSGMKIGVILKTLSSEYWRYVSAGIQDAEEVYGCEILLQGPPSETSYDQQMQMIETALGTGDLDALVISPLQPDMVANAIADAKIPVIALDTKIPSDKALTFVGTGNEDAGYQGASYIADMLEEGDEVAIISGVQGDPTAEARMAGFKKAIEEKGLNLVATQFADAVAEKAVDAMQSILQTNPDVKAVFCNNDEMAVAANRAARQAGNDQVLTLGFDGIKSGVEAIIEGNLTASIAQAPYEMGLISVEKAIVAAKGETLDEFYDTGTTNIDSNNASDYLVGLEELLSKVK